MHDATLHSLTFTPRLQALARSLNYHHDPRVLQSMIICKQPSHGAAVPHHNDSTFLYTDPPSALGFWFALEDCTRENGCLSFLKGSHRWTKGSTGGGDNATPLEADASHAAQYGRARGVNRRFVRKNGTAEGTTFQSLAADEETQWDEDAATLEECPAGTLVLIHGSVLHQSKKNTSDKSRYIYTFHMIEGDESRAKYDELNWLQPVGASGAQGFSRLYDPPSVSGDGKQ